eukprot:TRINITY_DN706_c0_g1_i1.p1 TRINITY_DN706_c0_g1~~TRINITY_DN706_c0_g1_i1.p1  ORF type:complete len:285 (+),score=61.31 TRINITY_DN706_c0_g1_i1:634-1488(+)
MYAEVNQLLQSDGSIGDRFGSAVAVSQGVVVVGAYGEDIAGAGGNAGAAFVFAKNASGLYAQTAKLSASDPSSGSSFGWSVAIESAVIVVGAYKNDHNAIDAGAVYVFERNISGHYAQVQKLVAATPAREDYFGISVAINSGTIVVGASQDGENTAATSAVYVFDRNTTSDLYEQSHKLVADDGDVKAAFGGDVAISGDLIVIGAGDDNVKGNFSGSVYVVDKRTLTGETVRLGLGNKLVAADGEQDDRFGFAVAAVEETVLVGAWQYDTDNGANAGAVYVYDI